MTWFRYCIEKREFLHGAFIQKNLFTGKTGKQGAINITSGLSMAYIRAKESIKLSRKVQKATTGLLEFAIVRMKLSVDF